jgi:ribosome-binding factor A
MTRRTARVEDLLRTEISRLILREVNDPRVRLASVSEVNVSPDLKQATVRVSALGEDEERQHTLEALQHASGFIRSRLAKSLKRMRSIPQLSFELDRRAEHSQHISDLLETIHDQDKSA